MNAQKKIVIIAGPNGAGKTTFAREFLPFEAGCPAFINADLIAAGLSPFQPETAAFRAGRLMLEEIAIHVAANKSFAFETTLSGLTYARMIPNGERQIISSSCFSYPWQIRKKRLPASQCGFDRVGIQSRRRRFADALSRA